MFPAYCLLPTAFCLLPTAYCKRGLIVGLTGGMACGKSTVAAIWREIGAYVLHSDETAHRLLAENQEVRREVLEAFGERVLDPEGRIDRVAFGNIVFHDETARQRLMAILHPRTIAYHTQEAERYAQEHPEGVVVIDSPLLFESGLDRAMDVTVVVSSSHEAQIGRALARAEREGRTLTRAEVEHRISLQMSLNEKRRRATFVLENDSTLKQLRRRAEILWKTLLAYRDAHLG